MEEVKENLLAVNYKHLPERLLKLHQYTSESLQLNDLNIREKAMVASQLAQSILTSYYAEKSLLSKLQTLLKIKESEYRERYGKENVPRHHIQAELDKVQDIKDIKGKIDECGMVVEYLRDLLPIFKAHSYNIKNACDLIGFEN